MKKFKDLVFDVKRFNGGHQATMDFNNGYGVSVISGYGAYASEEEPYELAVFHGGELDYGSGITDDVLGYLTEDAVTGYMEDVQKLKRSKR